MDNTASASEKITGTASASEKITGGESSSSPPLVREDVDRELDKLSHLNNILQLFYPPTGEKLSQEDKKSLANHGAIDLSQHRLSDASTLCLQQRQQA